MNRDIIPQHCRLHQQDTGDISLLKKKVLYVERMKLSNDKAIICQRSRLKSLNPLEIGVGKEGISTRASFFIISETVIDDQRLYE